MRKLLPILLIPLIITCFLVMTPHADISVKLNGQTMVFEVPPSIVDGRTMVPVRDIFEALGATVTWNGDINTVTAIKDDITVKIILGSYTLYKNNAKIPIDVPAQIISSKTMVPVRAIAQCFSCNVSWNSLTSTVIITTDNILAVHFIDVSQGDSIFIELPDGKTMLIDAGESTKAELVSTYISKLGYSKINYIVATHPHSDHIGGMTEILNNFSVDVFYMPDVIHTTKTFENMINALSKNACKVKKAVAETVLFETNNLKASFIAPCEGSYKNINDYSAVVKLTYENSSFLFTGDAESVSENEMVLSGSDLSADVLKIGHHGSYSSTSPLFLKAVNPFYAIISLGADNPYGHPHESTLRALLDNGTTVLRTDILGTITLISDGNSITVKNDK